MALPCYVLASLLALPLSLGIVSANYNGPKSSTDQYQQKAEEDDSDVFQVQGLIYCRKHDKLVSFPDMQEPWLCAADDDGNDEGVFSVVSGGTDARGYFKIDLRNDDLQGITLSRCRVHLETHPPGICRIPTDVNQGLTGALLLQFRTLSDSSRLCSVPPFFYDASP